MASPFTLGGCKRGARRAGCSSSGRGRSDGDDDGRAGRMGHAQELRYFHGPGAKAYDGGSGRRDRPPATSASDASDRSLVCECVGMGRLRASLRRSRRRVRCEAKRLICDIKVNQGGLKAHQGEINGHQKEINGHQKEINDAYISRRNGRHLLRIWRFGKMLMEPTV